jgi:galactose mutarotase-like enzyme
MYYLSNDTLKIAIAAKGAELQSLYNTQTQLEYMWSGDAAFWGKKSPVLFPIVGGLKNNTYRYRNIAYTLPRHGFARDREFAVTAQTTDSITFTLQDDDETRLVYPFHFRFSIIYVINENTLSVTYLVENTRREPLYFSVGAHPAFSVPMVPGTEFTDFHLVFSENETTGKWPLSKDGLILTSPIALLENSNTLALTKELFYSDALVCKQLKSSGISIISDKTDHGLQVTFGGFPYMGIWSAKNANFVCIEPWCGIADSVDGSGDITQKEGINLLSANTLFTRTWSVEVF